MRRHDSLARYTVWSVAYSRVHWVLLYLLCCWLVCSRMSLYHDATRRRSKYNTDPALLILPCISLLRLACSLLLARTRYSSPSLSVLQLQRAIRPTVDDGEDDGYRFQVVSRQRFFHDVSKKFTCYIYLSWQINSCKPPDVSCDNYH